MTGNYILQRGRRALVGDMHDVNMRLRLEQFAGEKCGRAVTRGRKVELAGLCFRERDQFSHRVDAQHRIDHQDIGLRANQADWREILLGIVSNVFVETRIGGKKGVVADQ
jgi:hypothetical protein